MVLVLQYVSQHAVLAILIHDPLQQLYTHIKEARDTIFEPTNMPEIRAYNHLYFVRIKTRCKQLSAASLFTKLHRIFDHPMPFLTQPQWDLCPVSWDLNMDLLLVG